MPDTDRDTPVTALREALTDLTAAYHHERRHEGRWRQCQHPRCQNARLAMENRGPFASDIDEYQNFGTDDIPLASSDQERRASGEPRRDDVAGSGERLREATQHWRDVVKVRPDATASVREMLAVIDEAIDTPTTQAPREETPET